LGIVKDGLIRGGDRENVSQDECCFSCGDGERDMESKSKAEGVK